MELHLVIVSKVYFSCLFQSIFLPEFLLSKLGSMYKNSH